MFKKINLIKQRPGSRLCGQCCVAMAAGVSLGRAIEAVGHSRATRTRDIIKALRSLGVRCGDRLQMLRPCGYPRTAMLSTQNKFLKKRHWVLVADGILHDPEGPGKYLDYSSGWRILSYLEIYE